jgi:hypothetical protein
MRVLGITLKKVADEIVIELCELEVDVGTIDPLIYVILEMSEKLSINRILSKTFHLDTECLTKHMKPLAASRNFQVEGLHNNKNANVTIDSCQYTLSQDVFMMLSLLSAINTYNAERHLTHLCFSDVSLADLADTKTEGAPFTRGTINAYIKKYSAFNETVKANIKLDILALIQQLHKAAADLPQYKSVCAMLVYLLNTNSVETLQNLLSREGVLKLTDCNDSEEFAGTSSSSTRVIVQSFNASLKRFIGKKQPFQFDLLLGDRQASAKKALYLPSIGKTSHDKQAYTWNYTEWSLLRDADFRVRSDGRMSICLTTIPQFNSSYAPGRRNHKIFRDEFDFLGNIINLKIADDSDISKELIFTPECTGYLVSLGLHHDKHYVAALIYLWRLVKIFKDGQAENKFHRLPRDVIFMILEFVVNGVEEIKKLKFYKSEVLSIRDSMWGVQDKFQPDQAKQENSVISEAVQTDLKDKGSTDRCMRYIDL